MPATTTASPSCSDRAGSCPNASSPPWTNICGSSMPCWPGGKKTPCAPCARTWPAPCAGGASDCPKSEASGARPGPAPERLGGALEPFPDRQFGQSVLEFAPRLADDEGHVRRLAQQPEMRRQPILQAVQRRVVLCVFLEAAQPGCAGRVFFQPGVGRGDQQQAARNDALVDLLQEARRIVQAIDQVGGQDQVIA